VYASGFTDSVDVDRSLALTIRALELDNKNVLALTHKATLLFLKKDINGLLKTADNLIKLRPEKPFYLGQKAFYLELNGDSLIANEYYDKALSKYGDYLKRDSTDFNLMIEYVGILEMFGDTTLADETLRRMKNMNFDKSQKQILELYKEQSVSKEQLFRFWSGEIGPAEIERK
jgi:tetratricopeptide (TPR) repeat protein